MIIYKTIQQKQISYKITKQPVDYAIKLLKQNEQITMLELSKQIKKKYTDLMLHHNGYLKYYGIIIKQEKERDMNISNYKI